MSKPLLTTAISEIQDHANISTEAVCNQFVQIPNQLFKYMKLELSL